MAIFNNSMFRRPAVTSRGFWRTWWRGPSSCCSPSSCPPHSAPLTTSSSCKSLSLRVRILDHLSWNDSSSHLFPGCNKLQRKLLFADSLAKLPYKIGAIRGILTNLVNNLKELQFKTKTTKLASVDVQPAFSMFNDLQKSTEGLCRSVSKQKLWKHMISSFQRSKQLARACSGASKELWSSSGF